MEKNLNIDRKILREIKPHSNILYFVTASPQRINCRVAVFDDNTYVLIERCLIHGEYINILRQKNSKIIILRTMIDKLGGRLTEYIINK